MRSHLHVTPATLNWCSGQFAASLCKFNTIGDSSTVFPLTLSRVVKAFTSLSPMIVWICRIHHCELPQFSWTQRIHTGLSANSRAVRRSVIPNKFQDHLAEQPPGQSPDPFHVHEHRPLTPIFLH